MKTRGDLDNGNKLDQTLFNDFQADPSKWTKDQRILYLALLSQLNNPGYDKMVELLNDYGLLDPLKGYTDNNMLNPFVNALTGNTFASDSADIVWTTEFQETGEKDSTTNQDLLVSFRYTILNESGRIIQQLTGNGGTEYFFASQEGSFTIRREAGVYNYNSRVLQGIRTVRFYLKGSDTPVYTLKYQYEVVDIDGINTPGRTRWDGSNIPDLHFKVEGGSLGLAVTNNSGTTRLW